MERFDDKEKKNVQQSKQEGLPSRLELHGKKKPPAEDYEEYEEQQEPPKKSKITIPLVLLLVLLLLPVSVVLYLNKDSLPTVASKPNVGEEISFTKGGEGGVNIITNDLDSANAEKETSNEKDDEELEQKESEEKANKGQEEKEEEKEQPDEDIKVEQEKQAVVEEEKKSPPKQETDQNNAAVNSDQAQTYHTVQAGETLYRISMKYYQSQEGIEKIRQANGLSGNEINVGQKLLIP